MKKYETLVLLSPELNAEERQAVLDAFTQVVGRAEGSVEVDEWGMRELAYPVRKQMRGYYVRFVYVAPGPVVTEVERQLRMLDGVYKFMTVALEEEPAAAAEPAEPAEPQEA